MKVLIHFDSKKTTAPFEGIRLRKSLKGCCEMADITWVDSLLAYPEIAHFISPIDEPRLLQAKEEGIKAVVSAFYSENDPTTAFCTYPKESLPTLKTKSLRMLNEADLVLVPSEKMKVIAEFFGVKSRIEVISPGINLSRFEGDFAEREVFYRYFGVKPTDKYYVAIGNYEDEEALANLVNLAKMVPDSKFFYFGDEKRKSRLRARNKHTPANIIFCNLVEDDVYRSSLMGAKACLCLQGSKNDDITALESFAARTQYICLEANEKSGVVINKENAYYVSDVEKAAKLLESLSSGKLKTTINAGYATAKENSLSCNGKKLKSIYESLLSDQNK